MGKILLNVRLNLKKILFKSLQTKILELTKPRLTILTHILALGGIKLEAILKIIQDSTKNKFEVNFAYDLMAIDVKNKFNIYSVNYSKKNK